MLTTGPGVSGRAGVSPGAGADQPEMRLRRMRLTAIAFLAAAAAVFAAAAAVFVASTVGLGP